MVKDAGRFKHDLEHEINQRRNSHQHDEQQPKRQRQHNLAEMEPRRRGHIQIEIGVVNVMKPLEERDAVHRPMPPVVRPIHQQKCDDCGDDGRELEPVQ